MKTAILLSKDQSVLQKVVLETKQEDWNTQQNCIAYLVSRIISPISQTYAKPAIMSFLVEVIPSQ